MTWIKKFDTHTDGFKNQAENYNTALRMYGKYGVASCASKHRQSIPA